MAANILSVHAPDALHSHIVSVAGSKLAAKVQCSSLTPFPPPAHTHTFKVYENKSHSRLKSIWLFSAKLFILAVVIILNSAGHARLPAVCPAECVMNQALL